MAEGKPNKPKITPGYRVGKLTVEEETPQRRCGYTVWRCRCDCGGEILLDTRYLQRGTIKDCGCTTKVKPGQRDLTGMRFGKLVCIEPTEQRSKSSGGTVWRCRCDCGKECLAPVKQLTYGYKKSCGCLSHPPIKDYVGKRFGMLTVLEYAGKWDKIHHWKCLCDCGKETIVAQTPLQNGHTKSCGCNGNPPMEDLTGRIFGRLTVIEEAEWKKGTSYWRCKCECVNETVVKYGYLISGHTKSCGCLQKTQIIENLKLVEGMSITKLETRKNKLSSANTSGYTGVFQNKKTGKWVAQITFKGKCYHLGVFEKIEDAVKARQRGEEMYDDFLEWYYSEHPKQENKKET